MVLLVVVVLHLRVPDLDLSQGVVGLSCIWLGGWRRHHVPLQLGEGGGRSLGRVLVEGGWVEGWGGIGGEHKVLASYKAKAATEEGRDDSASEGKEEDWATASFF